MKPHTRRLHGRPQSLRGAPPPPAEHRERPLCCASRATSLLQGTGVAENRSHARACARLAPRGAQLAPLCPTRRGHHARSPRARRSAAQRAPSRALSRALTQSASRSTLAKAPRAPPRVRHPPRPPAPSPPLARGEGGATHRLPHERAAQHHAHVDRVALHEGAVQRHEHGRRREEGRAQTHHTCVRRPRLREGPRQATARAGARAPRVRSAPATGEQRMTS